MKLSNLLRWRGLSFVMSTVSVATGGSSVGVVSEPSNSLFVATATSEVGVSSG